MATKFDISSIDEINELGYKERNELKNLISVMASKFKCSEIIENILNLGDDDEGQTSKRRKAMKELYM